MSGANEASGPVLTSQFLAILPHCGLGCSYRCYFFEDFSLDALKNCFLIKGGGGRQQFGSGSGGSRFFRMPLIEVKGRGSTGFVLPRRSYVSMTLELLRCPYFLQPSSPSFNAPIFAFHQPPSSYDVNCRRTTHLNFVGDGPI